MFKWKFVNRSFNTRTGQYFNIILDLNAKISFTTKFGKIVFIPMYNNFPLFLLIFLCGIFLTCLGGRIQILLDSNDLYDLNYVTMFKGKLRLVDGQP